MTTRRVIEEVTVADPLASLLRWEPGTIAYRCPECQLLHRSVGGAADCCADTEAYEAAMRQACWPVSSDPTVRRRTVARISREHQRRPGGGHA